MKIDGFTANFNYAYYPLPHDPSVGYKQAVNIDQLYMTSAVKDENKQI